MSDTPNTFRNIAEEAMSDLTSKEAEKPTEAIEEVEESSEEESPKETTQETESFAEDVNLEGMTSEELLEVKKNWERAYTQKRQKETAELKELRDKLKQYEESSKKISVEKQEAPKQETQESQIETDNLTVAEYTKKMEQLMEKKALEIAKKQFEQMTSQQREESYQEKAFNDFISADDRLNENNPNFDDRAARDVRSKLAQDLDNYLSENGTAKGFDAKSLSQKYLDEYYEEIDKIVQRRTQQSLKTAKMREAKSKKNLGGVTTSDSRSTDPISVRDILGKVLDEAQ